jgi:hypothetical protein
VTIPEVRFARLSGRNLSCKEIGGDFFDAVNTDAGLTVVLADVSGKGVSAAILASTLQGMIYSQLTAGMPLTDIVVRKAKARAVPYKMADGGGMYVLVRPDGARYWRMDYRWEGRRRTLALGVYLSVSLSNAREKRDQAKKQLAAHTDPATQRKLDKIASNAASKNTFRLISLEWVQKLTREGRSRPTLNKVSWLLELAYPAIGDQPIASINPTQLLTVLRKVEARGRYETARRLRSTCGQVFRYAIATARAERDPSADLRGALTSPKVRHHAAVVDPKGVGALLRAIDGYDGTNDYVGSAEARRTCVCSTW